VRTPTHMISASVSDMSFFIFILLFLLFYIRYESST
jgi:hypothetical protein